MGSIEETQMRAAVTAWGRARWPGCRVLHELVLGERRIDLVFVSDRDLAGVEIKSSVDRLTRLADQMKEFSRYLPEVWAAFAPRWIESEEARQEFRNVPNLICVDVSNAERPVSDWRPSARKPVRDELVCSRLLELLWRDEAARIAQRMGVIPGVVHTQMRAPLIKKMLARLLTGNEIIREVCAELKARPLVGLNSDGAMRAGEPASAGQ